MICRAKYHSVCYRCATGIRPGQYIEITRGGSWGGEVARHAACQTERERAVAPWDAAQNRYANQTPLPPPSDDSRAAQSCKVCGKPLHGYRKDVAPTCDACLEKARIDRLLRELDEKQVAANDRIVTQALRHYLQTAEK